LGIAFIENLILEGAAHANGTGNGAVNGIIGNSGNNILAGQAGNDSLIGGAGNDQLFGQADKDSLTGGSGDDRFVYQSVIHTAAGLGDVIVDFDDSGDDVIDLTGIAGITTYNGINAFTAPGQVRIQQVGANVLVQINTVGNDVAEGEIIIANATIGLGIGQVSGGDFLW
jgi:Ca2+-binding RTX toxin-like protein